MPPYDANNEKAKASDAQATAPVEASKSLHKDATGTHETPEQLKKLGAAATLQLESQGLLPSVQLSGNLTDNNNCPVPNGENGIKQQQQQPGGDSGNPPTSDGGALGGAIGGIEQGLSGIGSARRSTITAPEDGEVTKQTKDGLLNYISYGDGHSRTFERDAQGKLVGITNSDGSSWVNNNGNWEHRDASGKVVESGGYAPRVFADGTFQVTEGDGTTYSAKPDGTMEATRGDGSKVEYNSAGQPTSVDYPGGSKRSFEYDHDGQLTGMTDVNGKKWTLGDNGKWTLPDGTQTDGNVSVDPEGSMSIGFDNGPHNVYLASGASLEKDANGDVTKVNYKDGKSRSFERDASGNITKITETDGNTWSKGDDGKWHEFGKNGQATGKTNDATPSVDDQGNYTIKEADGSSELRKSDGSDVKSNKDGQVTEVDYPNGETRTFKYDKKGLSAMIDSNGQITARDDKGNWKTFNKKDPFDIKDANQVVQVFPDGTIRQWDGGDILTSTDNVTSHPNPGHNLWGVHSDNPLASITPDAVHQGDLGDCYFLSCLSSEAKANPQAVMNMIKDNGNGTYTVTFPGDPDHPVTVDAPTEQEIGSYAHDDGSNGMWVNVIEKAHRQYTGRETSDNGDDPTVALKLLSPKGSHVVDDDLSGGWFGIGRTDEDNVKKDIINGLKDHKIIVADTADGSWLDHLGTTNDPGSYVNDHAWAVTGYDEKTNMVTIRNPWGGTGGDNGTFTISLNDFYNKFQDLDFSNS